MIPPKGTALLTRHKHCPPCEAMKKRLQKANIPFTEVYIEGFMGRVRFMSVPQLYHDGSRVPDGEVTAWIRRNR